MHICRKKLFFLLTVSGLILFVCSCSDSHKTILPEQITVISGSPSYRTEGNSVICNMNISDEISAEYKIPKTPLTYYTVKTEKSGEAEVILTGSKNDINSRSICSSADEHGNISRVIRSSRDGILEFSIIIRGSGNAEINNTTIFPAEENNCTAYKNETGNIRILLKDDDVQNSGISEAQIINWLNSLEKIRNTVSEWSENGLESLDICAVNEFNHYGLSGDPIYICESYIAGDLKKIADTSELPVQNQDILWGVVHEICHAADGFGHGTVSDRIFDSEFSAQLECACALDVSNYRYNGEKTAAEFFAGKNTLGKHLYSDEAFLCRLFEIFEEHSTALSEIIPVFSTVHSYDNKTDEEKLNIFFDDLENILGYSVKDCFTNSEMDTITSKFNS